MIRKRTLIVVPTVLAAALAGSVAFGTAKPPSRMAAIDSVAVEAERRLPLPPLQHYPTRDGAALAYRSYPAPGAAANAPVAILIHGSTGSSAGVNILGQSLAQSGMASYAPDIRGHGASGERGDIGYIGQLEDDLTDLLKVVHREHPGAPIVLVGHSSGGGFALRVASEPEGKSFARFVLISPFLGSRSATTQANSGGWVSPYIPRIAGLTILNRVGVTAFNGLPTLAFAASPGRPVQTWSYRLMQNFAAPGLTQMHGDPNREAAAKAAAPIAILAGDKDESMVASAYAPAFQGLGKVSVSVIPGVGHMGMLSDPRAVPQVTAAIRGA